MRRCNPALRYGLCRTSPQRSRRPPAASASGASTWRRRSPPTRPLEPFGPQFGGLLDLIGACIGGTADLAEHLPVGGFAARNENHRVEPPSESRQMSLAVGDLPADRVVHHHLRRIGRAAAHLVGQPLEKRDALRRLRQEVNRPREIDLREILLPLDDQRRRRHLSVSPTTSACPVCPESPPDRPTPPFRHALSPPAPAISRPRDMSRRSPPRPPRGHVRRSKGVRRERG